MHFSKCRTKYDSRNTAPPYVRYIFFLGVGGWWGVPDSVTSRSKHFFAYAGLDVTEAMTEFAWMCLRLSAEDQPGVPHKTFMEVAVVSSIKCYPLHYLYKALWKCENGYLNRVVQLRIKAVTRYANQQWLGTARYFTWYRYFSLLSFTIISSCGEDAICCVAVALTCCHVVWYLWQCFLSYAVFYG